MVIVCYRLLSIVLDFLIDNNWWIIVSVTSISFDVQYQSITRACLHECGGPQVGEVTCLGEIKKITLLYMHYWMVTKHVKKKNAGKPRTMFWWLMLFYTHLRLLLKPSELWLSIATFNNHEKPPPKWILREFDVSRIRPQLWGLPYLERVTRFVRPGYPP